jgi:hypothetical protein
MTFSDKLLASVIDFMDNNDTACKGIFPYSTVSTQRRLITAFLTWDDKSLFNFAACQHDTLWIYTVRWHHLIGQFKIGTSYILDEPWVNMFRLKSLQFLRLQSYLMLISLPPFFMVAISRRVEGGRGGK